MKFNIPNIFSFLKKKVAPSNPFKCITIEQVTVKGHVLYDEINVATIEHEVDGVTMSFRLFNTWRNYSYWDVAWTTEDGYKFYDLYPNDVWKQVVKAIEEKDKEYREERYQRIKKEAREASLPKIKAAMSQLDKNVKVV